MLIVLSLYFLIVWLVFYKFRVLKFSTGWKALVYTIAIVIAYVVLAQLAEWSPQVSGGISARATQIAPRVSGLAQEVLVQPNQVVEAGEVLFTLDPEPFQYGVDQLQAALDLLTLRFEQTERLVRTGAARAFDLESLEAEIAQLEAQLGSAQLALSDTRVRAPSQGVVPDVLLTAGEFVAAGRGVMSFINTEDWVIVAEVAQNGLRHLEVGTPVSMSLDAMPGSVFTATVREVPAGIGQGQFTPTGSALSAPTKAAGTYVVVLDLPEDFPEDQLRMGVLAAGRAFPDDMPGPWKMLGTVLLYFNILFQYL